MSGVTEVLFDMSFALGIRWPQVPLIVRENLMDLLQGSRGLYDWVMHEATTFEEMWVALGEGDASKEDYYGEVDKWFDTALDKLILRGYNNV